MLNRKFADFRDLPRFDPRLLRYDPAALPQAVVRFGPASQRLVKGGVVLGDPGFTWAIFFFPGRWYVLSSVYDAQGGLVAHRVDLCVPPEEQDGVLSFLDLKLDLLLLASGEACWVDQDDYDREIRAGRIPVPWQEAVAAAVSTLDREVAAGTFPPREVRAFRLSATG